MAANANYKIEDSSSGGSALAKSKSAASDEERAFSDLPLDLVQLLLSFVGPRTLCRFASCSRVYVGVAEADELWLAQCQRRWKGKAEMSFAYEKCSKLSPRVVRATEASSKHQ